jgi:tetratricopeptide (TPR) repeat protein
MSRTSVPSVSLASLALTAIVLAGAIGACSGSGREERDGRDGRGRGPENAIGSTSSRPVPSPLLPAAAPGFLAPSLARFSGAGSVSGDAPTDVPRGSGDANADVEDCAQCHADVASQWRKSAHAFASFDNPVYRVVVDRFRKDRGERPSLFCGGCHDVALLIDGAMLSSIEPADPRAQAGITCKTCHSVDAARADGNASWDLDLSPIPIPKEGDPDSILRHRARVGRATLRSAAMCSSCHKAFLDESTGNAHHLVGQDDVSPWERSAFAGSEAARIDEDVPRRDCRGCHMPRVAATRGDAGAKNGSVASHLFLGGHTWLASMQGDAELVAQSQAFLADRVLLDVGGLRHESGRIDVVGARPVALVRGEHAVVDVALRNLDVGHRFPGGVMDAQGTWLEITIDDKLGRRVAEAGTTHETSGADPTAHVLSSYMARADGSRLDVRETHEFAAGVFNNTLAPRDATVVGYGFVAPDDASRYPLTVTARLRHRSRNLELQRAACGDSRTERGRAFGRAGSKKVARALDACRVQPVTELATAVVWLSASASADANANANANANVNAVAARAAETAGAGFARRYAYGLGLSHALSERLDDARAPLLAALELAQTPRQRAMALGALAMIAAKEGRTDETFALAERADAAAREAGMPPPIAMQRARAEVLAATWRLAEAAPLFLEVAARAPRDDTAWASAAITFGGAGDPYAALDAARRGLTVQPRDGDLLRVQALSLQEPSLHVDAWTRAAAEAAFLERRTPDAAPAIRGTCSANVPGCANERIPVHVHAMRQR